MEDNEFVRHLPCDNCGSSDANSLYSDGHTFCFVCHHRTAGEGELIHNRMPQNVQLKGQAERLVKRNISEKTNQFFRIYRDGDTLRFPYFTDDGILKGIKIKTKKKGFTYEGVSTDTLFGQHLFPSSGKRIVVTEGELDAASVYEAYPGWPVVSLPHGAASAKKDIKKQIEYLQGYESIIILFDNDEPGQNAAKEVASILPPGNKKLLGYDEKGEAMYQVSGTLIAKLSPSYKDASDALMAWDNNSIRKAIWNAEPYRPDGIVDGKSLLKLVTTPQAPFDHEYPFEGLNKKLHGIRYGELTTFTSGSGSGKTSLMRALAVDLLNKGEHVGILELEASNQRTALGLMSTAVGKNLHLGEHDEAELRDAFERSIANWNLYLFDGFGSFDPEVIYNRIEYLATGLDCKVILLDHLSILLSGLDGDERRMLDQTMTKLRSLVERTGIALFLVSHLRRSNSDNHTHEEGGRVSLSQLRGSHSIAQLSDSVIALERDQQAKDQRGFTTLRVLKNRYSGETNIACKLDYDLSTCRFIEHEIETTDFNPATDF